MNKLRKSLLAVSLCYLVLSCFACRDARDTTEEPPQPAIVSQTTCPVMGGAIDKSLYVDHEGKRIYACCAGCIDTIKADPKKYMGQLEAQGITLDTVPVVKVR